MDESKQVVDVEAFNEAMRNVGEITTEMYRQALTALTPAITAAAQTVKQFTDYLDERMPGWRQWADDIPDYSLVQTLQGCHCLCTVAHDGIGACTGEAEPDLVVVKTLDGNPINIPVCRPCFDAVPS